MTNPVVNEPVDLFEDEPWSEANKSFKKRRLITVLVFVVIIIGAAIGSAYSLGYFNKLQLNGTTWVAEQIPYYDDNLVDLTITFNGVGLSKNRGGGVMFINKPHSTYTQIIGIDWVLTNKTFEGKHQLTLIDSNDSAPIMTLYLNIDSNGRLSSSESPSSSTPDILFRLVSS